MNELEKIRHALQLAAFLPELNLSNYGEDEVCQLNERSIEAGQAAYAALESPLIANPPYSRQVCRNLVEEYLAEHSSVYGKDPMFSNFVVSLIEHVRDKGGIRPPDGGLAQFAQLLSCN